MARSTLSRHGVAMLVLAVSMVGLTASGEAGDKRKSKASLKGPQSYEVCSGGAKIGKCVIKVRKDGLVITKVKIKEGPPNATFTIRVHCAHAAGSCDHFQISGLGEITTDNKGRARKRLEGPGSCRGYNVFWSLDRLVGGQRNYYRAFFKGIPVPAKLGAH